MASAVTLQENCSLTTFFFWDIHTYTYEIPLSTT